MVRRGSGSVVTWQRAQMVLLSAPGMDVTVPTRVGACPLYRRGKRVFPGVSLINTGR